MKSQGKVNRNCGPYDEPPCETSEPGERIYSKEDLLPLRLAIGQRMLDVFGFCEAANIVFRLKTTPDEVHAVLNGEHLPSTELLLAIQKVTGASIDWLLTGAGEKYISPGPAERPGARETVHKPQMWFVSDENFSQVVSAQS